MAIIVPDPQPTVDFGADNAELELNRANTQAFIDARPMDVTLIPRVKAKSHTGVITYVDGTPRITQTGRLISMSFTQRPTITVDGVERIATFTLLLPWDALVDRYDYFVVDGIRYEVLELVPFNGYEIRALVDAHG